MTRPYNLEDPTLVRPVMRSNLKYGVLSVIAGAQYTIDIASPPVVMINPTAGAIDVLLPVEAEGLFYWITNLATSGALTLKDSADVALGGAEVVAPLQAVMAICDGTAWRAYKLPLATS